MKLRATGNHVLVKPVLPPERSHGGIHMPIAYQQPSGQGTILSVGGRVKDDALKIGAMVFFSWINGQKVNHDNEECVMVHEGNLIAVV